MRLLAAHLFVNMLSRHLHEDRDRSGASGAFEYSVQVPRDPNILLLFEMHIRLLHERHWPQSFLTFALCDKHEGEFYHLVIRNLPADQGPPIGCGLSEPESTDQEVSLN